MTAPAELSVLDSVPKPKKPTRLGSTSYAAYHSAADVPGVVQPDQLERVGRVMLAWLAPRQTSAGPG